MQAYTFSFKFTSDIEEFFKIIIQQFFSVYTTGRIQLYKQLHGLSPRVNYTDRATAACQRSDCQLLRIEGATWSA
jgi:hypothetical protein